MSGGGPAPAGPEVAEYRSIDRLRTRLALILLIALSPALVWTVDLSLRASRAHWDRLTETVRSVAALASRYEAEFLDEVEATLRRLAADPRIITGVEPFCGQVLKEEFERSEQLAGLGRIAADGVALCNTDPMVVGHSYADRGWFQRLMQGDEQLVVSELLEARVQRRSVIVLALPIRSAAGFEGAVAVGVKAEALSVPALDTAFPSGTVLVLVDRDGRPLSEVQSGLAETSSTLPDQATLLRSIRTELDAFTADGRDGMRRIYSIEAVAQGQLNIVIGVPVGGRFDWLEREVVAAMLGPIAMLLVAVAAIWVGTQRLVIRHVNELAQSARQWGRGQLDRRPDLAHAPEELRELGATFGRMASRIAEREAELNASLAQKEMLLKEVHHRVKNNLQIVASLLSLRTQAMRSREVREALSDVQTRIKALALVHRKLYEHDQPTTIDLSEFLADLAGLLSVGVGPEEGSVEVVTGLEPIRVQAEQAMPLALLVTEVMTNSLKHAFPADRDGRVTIRLARDSDRALLTIEDNGVGRSGDTIAEGLGLKLCGMLAKQMGATIEVTGPPGTTTVVKFPIRPAVNPNGALIHELTEPAKEQV